MFELDEHQLEEINFPVSEAVFNDEGLFLNSTSLSCITRFKSKCLGMDCYADDRDALNDFAKYYNNDHLSDVCIIIEEER